MSTPNYLAVILDLYDGGGNPETKGTAALVPSAVLTDAAVEVVGQDPVIASFRAGSLPKVSQLLATDNAGPLPSGWTWAITFSGQPAAPAPFSFFLPANPMTFTATSASPAVFTGSGSAYLNGTGVQLSGSLPAGFTAGTTYYVVSAGGSTFQLAATAGGSPIASTSTGSGSVIAVQQFLSNLIPVSSGSTFQPSMPLPSASDAPQVMLFPSGDITGAADAAAIIAAIQPVTGGIPAVRLAAGKWWLNQTVAALANSTVIEGAGSHATRVNAVAGFTGTDVLDSGGFQFVTFAGLSIVGPAGSLGGATQLNGLRKRSGARFTGRDLFFTGLNGLSWYTDASGTDSQMTMDNVRVQSCAGGHYLHGTHTGQVAAVLTACSWATPMGTATGPAAGLQPFQVEDYWDLICVGMAPTVIKGSCVSCTFTGVDQAPPTSAQPAILIEDGTNGSPLGIIIGDGIAQDGSIGVQITGGADKITLHNLQVSFNQTHGVSVEGTGAQIRLINVDHYHNGKAGSAGSYDLNWTGTATGKIIGATFDTAIGSGTTTVTASVNNAVPGVAQFVGSSFPQAGVPGTQYTNPAGNASFTPADPTATASGTLVMMGLGSVCAFTPSGTGRVLVTVTGGASTLTAAVPGVVGCRFGTGSAPANGAAVTGTRFGSAADVQFKSNGVPATVQTFAFTAILALTPGTAYWFDLALDSSNPSDSAEVKGVAMSVAELP